MSVLLLTASGNAIQASDERPNIIFILLDDLGKEWVSCYGAADIQTPNVGSLAQGGTKFHNFYSMPQCTPTRASFMTGQYPFRNGWVYHWDAPRWGAGYFDSSQNPSIARVMKNAGYKTAIAGKWQMNDFRVQPDVLLEHGFDDYCMWTGAEGGSGEAHMEISKKRYWDPYIHTKEGSKTYLGEFGPDVYNQFLLDFIGENKDAPFFVYYPMALPHTPYTTTPHKPNVTTEKEKHVAMVEYADFLLGRVVSHLDALGIRDNTIVIWTTDNGSSKNMKNNLNGRLVKGGKGRTQERGVNAPFIVNAPGLVPSGQDSQALIDITDMLPTFAEIVGATLDSNYVYDGVALKDALLGQSLQSPREWILAMGGHSAKLTEEGVRNKVLFRDRVVRNERYKIYIDVDGSVNKLYDLQMDPGEKKNRVEDPQCKGIIDELSHSMDSFLELDEHPKYEPLPKKYWYKPIK